MPQAARKDAAAQRAQDKESKRARGAMSCAECRRLKLKCDKTVPCSSCKRRGCAQICPNGSLITGQGTRFVLADTEKLHSKISQMSDRIRLLEDALAILQSTLTREPHPLLQRDLLNIKSSIELHSAVEGELEGAVPEDDVEESQYIDAFGTLAIRDDGAATFFGRSAGSESLLIDEPANAQTAKPPPQRLPESQWQSHLPQPVSQLSGAFPLKATEYFGVDMDTLAQSFLPPWPDAWRLCELYLEQAPWFFGAVTKRQLHEEILPLWYSEAQRRLNLPSTHSTPASSPDLSSNSLGKGGAHDLALIFVIFCFGALTDMALPSPPDNADAEQYYQLTRAALTLEPVLDRPPSVSTVQTLSLMAIYQGLCSGENSIESTWALFGLATRLSQSIGLHRDCARWKLSPAEVQKRRSLFWELFITDCWQSLATGRLPTFSLPFVDCELPYDPDQMIADDGSLQPSFPAWKARFGYECVSAVVQGTLTSRAPKYSIILDLDRKIRDMDLPSYAQTDTPKGAGLAETMSHFMPHNYRELTLLYVHRCFFAHAISSHPNDPIKSQYAPSFLAGYRSACNLVNGLKEQFSLFPAQIARFWVLWTHAFSSAVMLSSVVTHSSACKVAPAALLELRKACDLFEKAATYGGRAKKFLPILKRLHTKAHESYLKTQQPGMPARKPNDIFTPTPKDEQNDELSIFSGKTHTVSTKANLPPRLAKKPSQLVTSDPSPSSSREPPHNYTTVPSFAGVHPMLVDELHTFDGHLNDQIQNAYYNNNDSFARTLMEQRHQLPQQQYQSPPATATAPSPVRTSPSSAGSATYQQPTQNGIYNSTPMYDNSSASSSASASASTTPVSAHFQFHPESAYDANGHHHPQDTTSYDHRHHATPYDPQPTSFEPHQLSSQSLHSFANIHAHPQSQYHYQEQPQYWECGPEQSYPTPQMDQYSPVHPQPQPQPRQQRHHQHQHQQPTENGEDVRLQETWTNFMYQVGSPAAFMSDN